MTRQRSKDENKGVNKGVNKDEVGTDFRPESRAQRQPQTRSEATQSMTANKSNTPGSTSASTSTSTRSPRGKLTKDEQAQLDALEARVKKARALYAAREAAAKGSATTAASDQASTDAAAEVVPEAAYTGFDPHEGVDAASARLAKALGLPYGNDPKAVYWVQEAQEKAARAALFGDGMRDGMNGGDASVQKGEADVKDIQPVKDVGDVGNSAETANASLRGQSPASTSATSTASVAFAPSDPSPPAASPDDSSDASTAVAADARMISAASAASLVSREREVYASEDLSPAAMVPAVQGSGLGGVGGTAGLGGAASVGTAGTASQAGDASFDSGAPASDAQLRANMGEAEFLNGSARRATVFERLRRTSDRLQRFVRARREREELGKVKGQREETRRQRLTMAGVVVVVVAVAAALVWVSETTREPRKPEVRTYRNDFRLAPDSLDKQSFQRQYEEKLDTLGIRLKSMEALVTQMDARMKALSKDGKDGRDGTAGEIDSRMKGLARDGRIPIADLPQTQASDMAASDSARLAKEAGVLTSLQVAGATSSSNSADARMGVVKVAANEKAPVRIERPVRRVGDAPIAANRARHEAERTYLPAGSFARATVLSGVTAPTGGNAAQNPMPLLLEVTHFANLPNDFKANVRRCFVTANATGDISSERVLVRLDRLSCMNKAGRAVDVRVQGYVTGEDGKAGVRARLVTRSGQAIASALFTGAISGLGKAVSLSAQRTTTYTSGAVGSSVDNAWAAGIGEGVDSAMDRIVNYYLKLADKIFPVLELDSGREVDIVLAQGLSIAFEPPKAGEMDATNGALVFGENMRARRENP